MDISINARLKDGSPWVDGLTIGVGFFPIAMAFGIIAREFGFNGLETTACSVLVFAGASQFAAVAMLGSGGTILDVIILVWLVNMRHFLMGMSLMALAGNGFKTLRPLVGFGLTDESYAFLSLSKKKITSEYAVVFQAMTYIAWVSGTVCGYVLIEQIPAKLTSSLGIALYGMFAALASMAVKSDRKNGWVVLSAGGIHLLLARMELLTPSWRLIAAMVITSILFSCLRRGNMTGEEG